MLDIKSEDFEEGKVICISDEVNSFEILMGGNGDLYFYPKINRRELLEKKKTIVFEISRIDNDIYPIFLRLYHKITDYEPFDRNESATKIERNKEIERMTDSYRKYPLVHDGVISWHSDEDHEDISSILNITLKDDKIILEFLKSNPDDSIYETYAIRIRNSGSRYTPFNCRFMELYNSLCQIDFNNHQISIEEFLEHQKTYTKK